MWDNLKTLARARNWFHKYLSAIILSVIPAKAGIQSCHCILDPRLRGDDTMGIMRVAMTYETASRYSRHSFAVRVLALLLSITVFVTSGANAQTLQEDTATVESPVKNLNIGDVLIPPYLGK